jgi:hypothetical protein
MKFLSGARFRAESNWKLRIRVIMAYVTKVKLYPADCPAQNFLMEFL